MLPPPYACTSAFGAVTILDPCLSPRSVCNNDITGDGAESLAKAALEHPALTSFCEIPLASLSENSLEELDLSSKSVGVPGAIVLSSLLPSASALKSLKRAPPSTQSQARQRPRSVRRPQPPRLPQPLRRSQ